MVPFPPFIPSTFVVESTDTDQFSFGFVLWLPIFKSLLFTFTLLTNELSLSLLFAYSTVAFACLSSELILPFFGDEFDWMSFVVFPTGEVFCTGLGAWTVYEELEDEDACNGEFVVSP